MSTGTERVTPSRSARLPCPPAPGALVTAGNVVNGVSLTFTASTSGTYTVLAYDWTAGTLAGSGSYTLLLD